MDRFMELFNHFHWQDLPAKLSSARPGHCSHILFSLKLLLQREGMGEQFQSFSSLLTHVLL